MISFKFSITSSSEFKASIQELHQKKQLLGLFCLLTVSYLLSEFGEFSHTPPQSSLAESYWSGSPEGRQAYCSYLPLFSTSAKLAPHNKAGNSLCLVARCFYSGRVLKNELLLQACQWVWLLNCLL